MDIDALTETLLSSAWEYDGTDEYWFPASHSQRALWFICDSNPEQFAYNIPIAYRVQGKFDAGAMARAIETVLIRHDTFRTTFVEQDGEIHQVVRDGKSFNTPIVSVADADDTVDGPEAALEALLGAWLSIRFDLAEGPLVKTAIIEAGDDLHYLLIAMHHTIIDHLSIMKMRDEFGTVYEANVAGKAAALPELEVQYPDYAVWQNEEKTAESVADRLGVWTEVLTSQVGCINLPIDCPRPRIQSFSGSELRETLAPELAELARDFAKARNVSPFVVMLSVYYVLLHRYARQELILVGVPFANRTEAELEDVLGLFINTLPLPMQMDDAMSFSDLVDATRKLSIRVQGAQDVPLGFVVEQTNVAREPSYNPMFQMGFTFQDPPVVMQIPGLTIEDLELHSGGSMYDLHTWLWDNPDGSMGFQIWYDDAVYTEATVSRLMGHFRALLKAAAESPDQAIAAYNCLTDAELTAVAEWNATDKPTDEPLTIPAALFSRDRDWDKAAVRCDGASLSHAELRDLSAQIANHLQSVGVGAGDLVGVLMERRLDLLPTLLGIMRLGAGYVPLDPEYPVERLEFIAADAGVKTVCVHADTRGVLDLADTTFVEIDTEWEAIRGGSTEPAFAENEDPESIAYVIHTSGSTGRPKGVLIPHRAASNFLRSMGSEPGLSGDDVLLAVTTLSFDISVLELYLPILVGGTVVVGTRNEVTDGAALVAMLGSEGITTMQATPSTWRMMLAVGWDGPSNLRVLCGGEAFPRDLAERLISMTPEVWNMYGPTETTVWSTCKRIEPGFEKILIGGPIDNTDCRIRTASGAECPVGVPGELFIGGTGVAHGYLDRAELTAEKFVAQDDGGVLYATGDLAAWQPNGEIEHLGRIDSLVKVRGFRIELGEIEAAINDAARNIEAVTTVWSPTEGDDRIVAYLRSESGEAPSTGNIRKAIRRRLPNYMIPQHFVPIDEIPKTANGKIDRKNLPDPDIGGQSARNIVEPRNDTERWLVELWMKILGVPAISTQDNFFNAGGQSLLAVQMIGEIEKRYGVRLKARVIILETLAGIAGMLDDGNTDEPEDDDIPVRPKEQKKGLLSRLFGR